MAHTITITVEDTIYEKLKPFIEQQTIGAFLSEIVGKNSLNKPTTHSGIAAMRGSLHRLDTSDIREEVDRDI